MKIIHPTDKDILKLQAYCAQHFGNSHTADPAFTHYWFYREDEGWTIRLMMDNQEEIVGVVYYIRAPARLNSQSTSIYWVSTLHVKESYRQQGTGAKLLLHSYKTLPLLGSMCGNEQSLPLSRLLGSTVAGENIRRYIYLLSSDALNFAEPSTQTYLRQLFAQQRSIRQTSLSNQWRDDFPIAAEYEPLWLEFSQSLQCCVERSRDYMCHRYLRAPHLTYRILTIRLAEQLVGLAVVRFQVTVLGKVARVVDFLAKPALAYQAWHQLLLACQQEGAAFADFFVLGSYQHDALTMAGWLQASEVNRLESLPNLLSPIDYRRWSYSFHLGGHHLSPQAPLPAIDRVWFTKGDGDRDWPTPQLIKENRS